VFFASDTRYCPVYAVNDWLALLRKNGHHSGPLFISFRRYNRLSRRRLNSYSFNELVQKYFGANYTAHSLRASFVTIAKLNGAEDSRIMNQTKHKDTSMIRLYTRLDSIRQHNAAQDLGL
jgi:integrase